MKSNQTTNQKPEKNCATVTGRVRLSSVDSQSNKSPEKYIIYLTENKNRWKEKRSKWKYLLHSQVHKILQNYNYLEELGEAGGGRSGHIYGSLEHRKAGWEIEVNIYMVLWNIENWRRGGKTRHLCDPIEHREVGGE